DVLAGGLLFCKVAFPGCEVINPRAHRVEIAAHRLRREASDPAVVVERGHGELFPARRALCAVEQRAAHDVVAVGEDVGFDDYGWAHGAFGWELAAGDLRSDAFDDYSGLSEPPGDGGLSHGVKKSTASGGNRNVNE